MDSIHVHGMAFLLLLKVKLRLPYSSLKHRPRVGRESRGKEKMQLMLIKEMSNEENVKFSSSNSSGYERLPAMSCHD